MNFQSLFSPASHPESLGRGGLTDAIALIEVDPDGTVALANDAAIAAWGWTEGSAVSRDVLITLEGLEGADAVELPLQMSGLHMGALPRESGSGWVIVGYPPGEESVTGPRMSRLVIDDRRSGRGMDRQDVRTDRNAVSSGRHQAAQTTHNAGTTHARLTPGSQPGDNQRDEDVQRRDAERADEETENALRRMATTSPDHTIFSDVGLQILKDGLDANRGIFLLVSGSTTFTTVADTSSLNPTSSKPVRFGPVIKSVDFLDDVIRKGIARAFDSTGVPELCRQLGDNTTSGESGGYTCNYGMVFPLHDNGRFAGLLIFQWERPSTTDIQRATRLFGLFETLYSWISNCTRYSDTVSAIDDGLVRFTVLDDDSRSYLFATDQLLHLTGYRPAEIVDSPGEKFDWIQDLVHPDDRPLVRAHTMTLADGNESRVVYRIHHRDGSIRWLREFASPAGPARGLQIVRGILTDVSEMKAAEEVLVQAKKEAESSNRSKTSFIATLSHEIRTPLGALSGYAQLLEKEISEYEIENGVQLPDQIREFVNVLTDRSSKIQGLVHDLFELSNVEMGLVQIQKNDMSLHALLKKCVTKVRGELEEKGIALRLALDCADPIVYSDQHRLEQVFDRVISNASKFTSQGSVTIRTMRDDGYAIIEIEDTGIGISSDYQGELFQIFSQEEDWRVRKFEGTGLGLAFSRRVLDLLDGKIEVESEKGEGSLFRIRLPLAWS